MIRKTVRGLAVSLVALATCLPAHADGVSSPVVIELFTSQGCSSCPPADALLTTIARTRPDVLPLAFHVTYWNNLGWRDPYSFEGATARQRSYAHISAQGGIYTPQAVIGGTEDVIGSDTKAVEDALHRAADHATHLALRATRDGDAIAISLGEGSGAASILIVGYDSQHRTEVGRGENAGATLVESNIVRGLEQVGEWRGEPVSLRHAPPSGEHAAILVQASDGRILAAARVPDAPGS
jgi:hypothetical protein